MTFGTPSIRRTPEATAPRDLYSFLLLFVELSKPRVTSLVLITMGAGALLAPRSPGFAWLIPALLGTALAVASANTLNMYSERHSDALMERTRTRPLPSGKLSPEVALWFAVGTGIAGLTLLYVLVNPLTAGLTAFSLVSYAFIYTPLKRVSPWALHVGAVPGALPPVLGWSSVNGQLALPAILLFAILFVWQLPHFLAISIFRRREYARAGLAVLPNTAGLAATRRSIIGYSVLLLLTTLCPAALGMTQPFYGFMAGVSGLAFLGYALTGFRAVNLDRWARTLFFASMPYLVVVLSALVLSRR